MSRFFRFRFDFVSTSIADFTSDGKTYLGKGRLTGFRKEPDAKQVYKLISIDSAEKLVYVGLIRVDLIVILISFVRDRNT